MQPVIALDHGPRARPALFTRPRDLLLAWSRAEVANVLDRAEAARGAGAWVAGYIAYEAGYAFEPRLSGIPQHDPRAPLVALGVFNAPEPATTFHTQADAQMGSLSPILPRTTRGDYARSFGRLMEYIAAGDCYQVNLTFPLAAQLTSGTGQGLLWGVACAAAGGLWRVSGPWRGAGCAVMQPRAVLYLARWRD